MFKRIVLAVMLALTSVGANAACNPSDAPPNSIGCQPALPSAVQSTDLLLGWRPSLGKTASRTITPAQLLQAGLPGAFATLSASGAAALASTLSVGSTAIDAMTVAGGGTFGPSDYRQIEIMPSGTEDFGVGSPQILRVRRVGSDNTAGVTYSNLWVTRSSWVLTGTGAPAGTRFNAVFDTGNSAGADPGAVWGVLSTLSTAASVDSQSAVSTYIQAVRSGAPAGGKVGVPLEGAVIEFRDASGLSTATTGLARTLELDMFVNGADDLAGAVGREVMPIVLGKANSADASPTITSVIGVYPVAGDGVHIKRGITWAGSLNFDQSLFDTRDSVQGASAAAVWLKDGHKLAMDGGSTGDTSPPNAYLTHGSSRFQWWAGGAEVASVSDAGVGIIGGGAAPITLSSGIISVPASQSLNIRTSTAGQTITLGAPSAGVGNVLTVTPNSNGNSFFGSAPNDTTVTNRLTVGQIRSSGNSFALSGTVTPTAFAGTGSTATVTFAAITSTVIPVGSSVTISGATPAGYNGTYTVTASTNTTVSFASATTGALSVAGSMAYSMPAQRVLSMVSNWSGTALAGTPFYPYTFTIPSDTSDTGATGSGGTLMYLAHNWGGTAKGGKGGMRIALNQTSATNDPFVGVVNQQHVVGEWWGSTAFNAGGTGSGTLAAGSFYGTNPQILLQQGATYWRLANALGEANLALYASSRTLTVGGTVTAGDVLTVTFASADISGTPVSVSWTVGASQTTAMIANNIAAAIWSNAALANAKISASVSGSVVTLYWFTHIASLTTTVGTSGGATETLTLGSVTGGASADVKLMGSLIRLAEDTAPATQNSAFFLFTAQPGSGTAGLFNYGLVFGGIENYNGEWSWHKGSTLIGAGLSISYGGAGQTHPLVPNWAKYGLDFSKVGFSGNGGASIRVPGFQIASDTTGAVFVGGYKIAATSAGLLLDSTTGGTASAVAVSSGGGGGAGVATGNYVVGDLGHDAYGGQYEVATVNASTGAVATFTVRVYPSFTSGAAPANPIAVTGGSGSGWTVNATWPSAPRVQFQASGGNTLVGTGSAIATNATSGFLQLPTMAGAPTGAVGAAGQAAVVIDTTNNKICWSTGGGTWKCALGS